MRHTIFLFLITIVSSIYSEASFIVPEGWKTLSKQCPEEAQIVYVGKGKYELPPSLTLTTEKVAISLEDYIKNVKSLINSRRESQYSSLGYITTKSGRAHLAVLDDTIKWGDVRSMQVTLLSDGYIYNLTASALRKEYPDYYNQFFTALKSLDVK